jgi:DNA-binding NtrC family response regulator
VAIRTLPFHPTFDPMAKPTPPPATAFRLTGPIGGVDRSFPLPRTTAALSVGSDPLSQILVDDPGVSRHHAVLQVAADDRILVVDQGSKNGTFVNGKRVRHAELVAGDRLAFGPVELAVEAIPADDAILAVEVPASAAPETASGATTHSQHKAELDSLYADWLARVHAFLRELRASPHGSLGSALARLRQELALTALALVEVADGEDPAVLASAGEVDPGLVAELVAARGRHAPAGRRSDFVLADDATGFFVAAPGRIRGLVARGCFPGRRWSELLLAPVFELCAARLEGSAGPLPGPPRGAAPRELVLPPDHVRGVSAAATELYRQLGPLTEGDLPVLVVGETGVGKEHAVLILHLSSARRDAPLVAINCAAIPAELLESELFGIGDRVATGVAARRGKFLEAEGGTLFLDEIGEMPQALQTKLLRVLQERAIHPLGRPSVPIDLRVIAATNADVEAEMAAGRFRRDLYYRLAGFVLRIPPLRERRDDVPLLVESFVRRFSAELGKPIRGLTLRALRALTAHHWPGNVRELEHVIRRLTHLCPTGQAIDSGMLPEAIRANLETTSPEETLPADLAAAPELDLATLERRAIEEALRRTGGHQLRAAELLGITRHALRRRLLRHGLDDAAPDDGGPAST